MKVGLFMNWIQSYLHIKFEGCEHELHFPLIPTSKCVIASYAILYRPTPSNIGILIVEDGNLSMKELIASGLVKNEVDLRNIHCKSN